MEKVSIQKYLSEKKSIMNGQNIKRSFICTRTRITQSIEGRTIKPPSLKKEVRSKLNSGLQKKVPDGFVLDMRSLKSWRRKNSCLEIAKG